MMILKLMLKRIANGGTDSQTDADAHGDNDSHGGTGSQTDADALGDNDSLADTDAHGDADAHGGAGSQTDAEAQAADKKKPPLKKFLIPASILRSIE